MDAEKHQIRCSRVQWRRIGELAEREGTNRSALLLKCFDAYADSQQREPLPMRARAMPLSTGEMILAHIVIAGSEDGARVAMRASVDEWHEAVAAIPGLRAEIDRRAEKRNG